MSGNGSIVVDGVWKQYRRGRREDSLRGALAAAARRLTGPRSSVADDAFWALRDVSFEVRAGRVMGIIGANGAGKSTMLKLLSRIVAPTRGSVQVTGRVGALVELAAGFHPDLTGRENVLLQGALMGMSRRDIVQRFDEIVAFADVAAFIDTAVKHYSSGMHARLGFSVAAHLSPDVLLIDEVLSVGDHRFQQRAFTRLKELVASGAAVVVISHQLERVAELADEAILLSAGTIVARGRPESCVEAYIEGAHAMAADTMPRPYEITALTASSGESIVSGETLRLTLGGRVTADANRADAAAAGAVLGVRVRTVADERVVAAANARAAGITLPTTGAFRLDIALQMNVGPGLYRAQAVAWRGDDGTEWWRGPALVVRVTANARNVGPVFLAPSMQLHPDPSAD